MLLRKAGIAKKFIILTKLSVNLTATNLTHFSSNQPNLNCKNNKKFCWHYVNEKFVILIGNLVNLTSIFLSVYTYYTCFTSIITHTHFK